MRRLRHHLSRTTALVLSAHVAALTIVSAALCCEPDVGISDRADLCPVHNAPNDDCAMTECPMHAPGHRHDSDDHETGTASPAPHESDTDPTSFCHVSSRDDASSPALLLGLPGLLPGTTGLSTPDVIAHRIPMTDPAVAESLGPVWIPPPRV